MTVLERQDLRPLDANHARHRLSEQPVPDGLPTSDDVRTMKAFTPARDTLMSKPLPKLPNTRIVNIPAEELPYWARELDIDASGMDEATLRLRLKNECDRLFPIVYADYIRAYNEFIEEHGLPLEEWRVA